MAKRLTGLICGFNQALTLEAAFASIVGVDELIYVDAGSTDGSLDIAAKFGAKVMSFDRASASEGRNRVAEESTGDYLIWISPDDTLEPGGLDKIREAMESGEFEMLSVYIQEVDGSLRFHFPRVWKKGVQWIGRCHEYPAAKTSKTLDDVLVIHRRGPWHDNPTDPLHIATLLFKDIQEHPEDVRWLYYYAREWMNRGEMERAVYWFEKRAKTVGHVAELAETYLQLARLYWNMHEPEKAFTACLHAIFINPNFKEAIALIIEMSLPENKPQWERMLATATNDGVLFARVA